MGMLDGLLGHLGGEGSLGEFASILQEQGAGGLDLDKLAGGLGDLFGKS